MNKNRKTMIISVIVVIVCVLIAGYAYIYNIRKTALSSFKKEYQTELKNIENNSELEELTNDNWGEYYGFLMEQGDTERVVKFKEQNEMLGFFDAYEEYSNFNLLKKLDYYGK